MGVDNSTQPFPPAVTDRYERWPAVNDLDETSRPADTPAPPAGPRARTRVESRGSLLSSRRAPVEHAPLPPVGDFWDLENPGTDGLSPAARPVGGNTGVALAFPHAVRRPAPTPHAPPTPYVPPRTDRTVAPAASIALATGLVSIPLTLALGLGAVLGMIAIVAGVVGIRKVNRSPASTKGTGRAVTGIVCGAGSVLVGGPILLFLAVLVTL